MGGWPWKKQLKYGNKPTEIDGIRFSSRKEAKYYQQLKLLQSAGKGPEYFLIQVPIRLPGNVKYIVDFLEFYADGTVRYVDTKGVRTDTYKVKKKLVEDLYPIIITEI